MNSSQLMEFLRSWYHEHDDAEKILICLQKIDRH